MTYDSFNYKFTTGRKPLSQDPEDMRRWEKAQSSHIDATVDKMILDFGLYEGSTMKTLREKAHRLIESTSPVPDSDSISAGYKWKSGDCVKAGGKE